MKEKRFGKERFALGSQNFRPFFNHLLKLTFFGCNYSKVLLHEIVYRTKKSAVLHIASYDRMIDLFIVNGICGFEYVKDGEREGEKHRYTCGGKVIVRERIGRRREYIGYVISKRMNVLGIRLENGEIVNMVRSDINELGIWLHHNHHNDECNYMIIEYWPVRLKLLNSGYSHMTINRFVLSNDDHIILF